MDVPADHQARLHAFERCGHRRRTDVGMPALPAGAVTESAGRSMRDDDVGVAGNRVELRREELLSVAAWGVERPVVEPRLPRGSRDPQSEYLQSRVLQVVTSQPVR